MQIRLAAIRNCPRSTIKNPPIFQTALRSGGTVANEVYPRRGYC